MVLKYTTQRVCTQGQRVTWAGFRLVADLTRCNAPNFDANPTAGQIIANMGFASKLGALQRITAHLAKRFEPLCARAEISPRLANTKLLANRGYYSLAELRSVRHFLACQEV